jgi:nucleoside-diphosphate-sugar epimerase
MKGNYLIFGGSGFIGHHLNEVINEKADGLPIIFDIKRPKQNISHFEEIDVRNCIDTEYKPSPEDVIFNLAAVHRTPGHEKNEYFDTNLLGAEHICNYARKNDINTIVFTSSIAVYGTYEDQKSEQTRPMPDIPYGISKLSAEYIHKIWQKENPNKRRLIIVRPGVVFGKFEEGNFTRLINSIARNSFFYPGRKDTIKASIYVKDLVNALCDMNIRAVTGIKTYNLTYDPAPTIEEICKVISDTGKLKKPKIKLPSFFLLAVSQILYFISKKEGIHPDRVKKLLISNDVNGAKLKENFKLQYGLKRGILDWMNETNFHQNEKIF